MASLYDHPILYDLVDSEKKDLAALEHWRRALDGKNVKTALDVSIGTGSLTLPMAGLGIQLSGSDLSEKMLSRCREKADQRGVGIELKAADFRRVSKAFDRKFDLVASTGNSLAHVKNQDAAHTLKEMDALLNDGGYLYFDLRNWDKILKERRRFFLYPPVFRSDERVNLIQVWDYNEDGSMTFNILYTFEKDGNICRREEFHEHYYPVKRSFLTQTLASMGYTQISIAPLPVQIGAFDEEKTDWYCLIAKKGI